RVSAAFAFFSSASPVLPAVDPLSLHDALPISSPAWRIGFGLSYCDLWADWPVGSRRRGRQIAHHPGFPSSTRVLLAYRGRRHHRSEEHTSELQSRFDLVCRLLLAKKKCQTRIQ